MFLRLWGARLNLFCMEFRIRHLKLDFPLYRSNFQQCVHIRMEILYLGTLWWEVREARESAPNW